MIIKCIHGYFIVREQDEGEVARFNSLYSQDLKPKDDYFTFDALVDAPSHSLIAQLFLGLPAVKTYSGQPWEVMEQNSFVYDFTLKAVRPIASITNVVKLQRRLDSWFMKGLIQPGSATSDWQKITGYTCHLDIKSALTYNYSELTFL